MFATKRSGASCHLCHAHTYIRIRIYAKYTPHMFATLFATLLAIRMFTTFLVLPIAYSRDNCVDSVMPVLLVTAHTT